MATKAVASKPGRKSGHVPDFSGVPGVLVDAQAAPTEIVWGSRLRKSPYDPLLQQLAEAGAGKFLKFPDTRARVSIITRARKLGLRVTCGEQGGALYVRFDGRVEDDVKGSRRAQLLGALKVGPSSAIKLCGILRAKGDTTVDAQIVSAILSQMARTGEVIAQEGDTYALNPRHKAA